MIRSLTLLQERLALVRLPADAATPRWVGGAFASVTRTPDEVSIVCDETVVPGEVAALRGWRAFRVDGPIPLDEIGVLASVAVPLQEAGISLFALSTHDTDYVLIRDADAAVAALRACGTPVVVANAGG